MPVSSPRLAPCGRPHPTGTVSDRPQGLCLPCTLNTPGVREAAPLAIGAAGAGRAACAGAGGGQRRRPPPEARTAGAPVGRCLEAAPRRSHLPESEVAISLSRGCRQCPSQRSPDAASRFLHSGTVDSAGHTTPRCSQDWQVLPERGEIQRISPGKVLE